MPDFLVDAAYIFLAELIEPGNNSLRILVNEAKASGQEEKIPEVGGSGRMILAGSGLRQFEFFWPSYVACSITTESFALFGPAGVRGAGKFIERSSSAYLKYISENTFAREILSEPLRHWEINCENHCVDIVSTVAPEIRLLTQ